MYVLYTPCMRCCSILGVRSKWNAQFSSQHMEDSDLLDSGLSHEWNLPDPTAAIDVQLKEVFGSDNEEDFPLSHGVLEEGGGASQLLLSSIDESLDVLNATDQSDSLVGSDGKLQETAKPVLQDKAKSEELGAERESTQGDSLSDSKEEEREKEEKKQTPIRQSARLRKRKETFTLKAEDLVRPAIKIKSKGAEQQQKEKPKSPLQVAKEEEEGERKTQGEEEEEEGSKSEAVSGRKKSAVKKGSGDKGGKKGKAKKGKEEDTTDTGESGQEEKASPTRTKRRKTPQRNGSGSKEKEEEEEERESMDVSTEESEVEMETDTAEEEAVEDLEGGEVVEEEEEGESDDPDKLWCICQQPHKDRCVQTEFGYQ